MGGRRKTFEDVKDLNEAIYIPYEGGNQNAANGANINPQIFRREETDKPLKEKVFKWSFSMFVVGNLILELIDLLYVNKVFIN